MNKATKLIAAALVLAVAASGAWIAFGGGAQTGRVVVEVDGEVYCEYDMDEVDGIIPISTPNGGENRLYHVVRERLSHDPHHLVEGELLPVFRHHARVRETN